MHALRVLEFPAVLERFAEQCETPRGRALSQALEPSFDLEHVRRLNGQTREALDLLKTGGLSMTGLADVGSAVKRAAKGVSLSGQDLYAVGRSLRAIREAKRTLNREGLVLIHLKPLEEQLEAHPDLEARLTESLDGDGYVRSEASQALADARRAVETGEKRIRDQLQKYVSGKSRELLSDPIFTQRSGRYVIPLKAENRGKIKGIVHDTSGSGQTIYVEPEDIVRLGNALREAEAAEREEVAKVLKALSRDVGEQADSIRYSLEAGAELDLIMAKARLGEHMHGCLAETSSQLVLDLDAARHPLLERQAAVPLTITAPADLSGILITGPNTGGKTVAIKTVGLSVAMHQCGMLVPAEVARLGCFTQIWADIGDEQSIQQSLSTFSSHIKNISTALSELKPGALVLLDEAGAGTDPAEGAALARAILLAFREGGAKMLVSTHYGELKVFASSEPGFTNASMEFDRKSLRPTYRLRMGMPGSSHALEIARRCGVPESVLAEAASGFSEQEQDLAQMIEQLDHAERQARQAQSRADRLAQELEELKVEAAEEAEGHVQERDKLRRRFARELQELLREIRLEAEDVLTEVKKSAADPKNIQQAREKLKELQAAGEDLLDEAEPVKAAPQGKPVTQLAVGQQVRVLGFDQIGTVKEIPKPNQAVVQVGAMKMTVKANRLQMVEQPKPTITRTRPAARPQGKAPAELHLRRLRFEEAQETLERFIDEAVLSGHARIRIIHGKGGGVLRTMTRDMLRAHPQVQSIEDAGPGEGGDGATVAVLK